MSLKPPDSVTTSLNFASNLPINVKNWGARGDGITDDTLPIQAALDYGAGDEVTIPDGNFVVKNLAPSSNTILKGTGKLIQKANSVAGDSTIFIASSVSNVKFYDLEIDGNKANQPNGSAIHGIRIAGTRVKIKGMYIHDTEYNCVSMQEGAGNVKVLNCDLEDCGTVDVVPENGWGHGVNGEAASGITNVWVMGCNISGTGQHGVRGGDDCHSWKVKNNIFTNIGHDAWAAYNVGNTKLDFVGNTITNTQRAGCHLGGTAPKAAGNIMEDIGGGGVLFGSTPNTDPVPSGGGEISGNQITTVAGAAIELRNFSRTAIEKNVIDNTLDTGVQQSILITGNYGATPSTITDVTLTGNIIYEPRGAGIQLSVCTNCQITGGSVRFGNSRGIRLASCSNITISGVNISDNTLDGIFSDGATIVPSDITVSGCTIMNNGAWGVRNNAGDRFCVVGNTIRLNASGSTSLVGAANVNASNLIA